MSNTVSFTLEQMVARQMVRYDRLNYIFPLAFSGNNTYELNIYYDLSGLYRSIFSRQYVVNVSDFTAFTRSIINICTHYRGYFKFYNVKTNIFLIDSFCIPPFVKDVYPEYNKDMQEKKKNKIISEMVKENLDFLDILCPYLPDIHLIHTEYESGVIINELINRQNMVIPDASHLIISTDILPAQLCGIYDNVIYLVPIKHFAEDASVVISPKSHFEHLETFWGTILLRTAKRSKSGTLYSVSASNLGLVLSMSGYKYRNIHSIFTINKVSKIINEITLGTNIRVTPDDILKIPNVEKKYNITYETVNEIKKYYTGLDILYQKIFFDESVEPKKLHYENLDDPDALNLINEKYFASDPIDVFRL